MATGDIKSVVIRSDGFSADVTIDGWATKVTPLTIDYGIVANVPTSPKVSLSAVSLGFDASGNATTHTRIIYGQTTLRRAYRTLTITAGTHSGASCTLTVNAHGFNVGDTVVVSGCTPSAYNTDSFGKTVTAVTTNTITYTSASTPSGDITVGGLAKEPTVAGPQNPDVSISGSDLVIRVCLSEPIFAKDKSGAGNSGTDVTFSISSGWVQSAGSTNATSGTATNNSTLAYPSIKVQPVRPSYERIEASSYTFECVPFGWGVYSNRPFACVKATMVDEHSHSVQATITSWSKSAITGDSITPVVAAHDFSLSTMAQGDLCTINYQAYPWIGDSGSVVDSTGVAYNAPKAARPVLFLCDKDGTYPSAIAFVDYDNGNDTGGSAGIAVQKVGGNLATARAQPFKSIWYAKNAIYALNNSAPTSRGDINAGIIYLKTGTTHRWTGIDSTSFDRPNTDNTRATMDSKIKNTDKCELLITRDPATTSSRSDVVISASSTTAFVQSYISTQRVRIKDVTISGASAITFSGLGTSSTAEQMVFDHCAISNANVDVSSTLGRVYNVVYLQCTWSGATNKYGAANQSLVRGNTGPAQTSATTNNISCVVGNTFTGTLHNESAPYWMYYMNSSTTTSGATPPITIAGGNGVFVGNFNNVTGGTAQGVLLAVGDTTDADNIHCSYNTIMGSTTIGRFNFAYNDNNSTFPSRKLWDLRFNVAYHAGSKSDKFAVSSSAINNWYVFQGTSCMGNVFVEEQFPQDYEGLYSKTTGTVTLDLNGSFVPQSSSDTRNRVQASIACMPSDLVGHDRSYNGTGAAGAYAYSTESQNMAPVVTITGSPASYPYATSTVIEATAIDTEDGDISSSIVWTSNIQAGTLATGNSININTLNVGVHTLTATVTDSGNVSGSATISITITNDVLIMGNGVINSSGELVLTTNFALTTQTINSSAGFSSSAPNRSISYVSTSGTTITIVFNIPILANEVTDVAWLYTSDGNIVTGSADVLQTVNSERAAPNNSTVVNNPPTAICTASDVGQAEVGNSIYTFFVQYSGASVGGLDQSSIENNSNAIRVTGPNDFDQLATFIGMEDYLVQYQINVPTSYWEESDNGTYTISLEANQVKDLLGSYAEAAVLDTFDVLIDTSAPQIVGGGIVTTDGKLQLTANENLQEYHDSYSVGFEHSTGKTITMVDIVGTTITITFDTPIATGDVDPTWSYNNDWIGDIAGNLLGEVGPRTATNNSQIDVSDTEAPSIPTNIVAYAGDNQIRLTWSPSIDNQNRLAGYHIFRNGEPVWSHYDLEDTSWTDTKDATGLINGITYSYTISAFDASENESDPSDPVYATAIPSAVDSTKNVFIIVADKHVYTNGYIVFRPNGTVSDGQFNNTYTDVAKNTRMNNDVYPMP